MNKSVLNEGLDYQDMRGQVKPIITVDEYAAKMGKDSDVVTITFTVNSKLAGEDLVSWLEIGYDFILDASLSDGEIEPGRYLVFAEMNRRSTTPAKIVEVLEDLETLTNIPIEEWEVEVDDHAYPASVSALKNAMYLSPHDYKVSKEHEDELNEMRNIAGLDNKKIYDDIDKEIKKYISTAGL